MVFGFGKNSFRCAHLLKVAIMLVRLQWRQLGIYTRGLISVLEEDGE